jgi:O-antigen/teichoic acid export membrane protein
MSDGAVPDRSEAEPSTKRALVFVYVGYAFRYLYLLVLIPFYGRVLGAAEYGRLVAAMSLFQLVWLLSEYGFSPIGARDVVLADSSERARLYGRHCSGRVVMSVLGLAVGAAGTWFSPLLREAPLFGALATLNGVIAAFNLGWYFQGIRRFRTSVLLEIFGFAMNLALILALVHGPHDGWLVMASLMTSSAICTLTAHVVALESLERRSLSFRGTFVLIRESTALFIHRGLGMATASASTYLISLFASATELGYYGAAERLISAGLGLMQPANQVLISTVSRHIATEHEGVDRALAVVRKTFVGMTSLGVVMLLGAELLSGFVIPLLLGPTFANAVPLLKIMAVLLPFAAINQVVTGYVLIPFRFDRYVPVISGAAAAMTLALILLLGRAYGGDGVAWARVLGEISTSVLMLGALRRTRLCTRLAAI